MDWEPWAVLVVLGSALAALYLEAGPPDQVMLAALVVVWHLGLVTTDQAFAGFSNSSLITIGCLFVVARAVDRSKVVDRLTRGLLGQKTTERGAVVRLCATGMLLSGFLNNTPLVALLMPIVRDWARSRRFAASKFLIPLSYSTIMGGLLTIIGSSTNLVVNGLLEQSGSEPFGFFEPAYVALPVGAFALLYLTLLVPALLPGDRGGLFRALREGHEEMVTELELTPGFPLLGSNIFDVLEELGIERAALVKILRRRKQRRSSAASEIEGADLLTPLVRLTSWGSEEEYPEQKKDPPMPIFPVPAHEVAEEGDVLVLSLAQDVLTGLVAASPEGLKVKNLHPLELAGSSDEFVEVVLAPECPVIGSCVSQAGSTFRRLYGVALIAVRTRSKAGTEQPTDPQPPKRPARVPAQAKQREAFGLRAVSEKSYLVRNFSGLRESRLLSSKDLHSDRASQASVATPSDGRFAVGDIALVLVPVGTELPRQHFLLITRIAGMPQPVSRSDFVPLVAFCIGLALTVCAGVSMVRVAVTMSVFCVLGGWVRPWELRDTIDWHLLILIGSALGLAQAVQSSGLSAQAASAVLAAGLPPAGALALLFLLVMGVTELVTNNAAAALGLPLAVDLARQLGMASPRPLAMAVMLAASTSYACPIGYATNLMVLGPGGYSFGDFLRVGLPMDLIYWLGCSLVLPIVWPIQ